MVKENQIVKQEDAVGLAIARLDQLSVEASDIGGSVDVATQFTRAVRMSRVVKEIRECVKLALPEFRHLIGSPLGFKTDKQYSDDELSDIISQGLIRGLPITGNCINALCKSCYVTKEGFGYLLGKLVGLKDYKENFVFDQAETFNGKDVVRVTCYASWEWHGKNGEMKEMIPVRLNTGMGPDAAVGKATRKLRARVYERLTHASIPDGEVGDTIIDEPKVTPRPKFDEKPTPKQETGEAEQVDPNVSKLMDLIMNSSVDAKYFVEVFVSNGQLTQGQGIKDISPQMAKSCVTRFKTIEQIAADKAKGGKNET